MKTLVEKLYAIKVSTLLSLLCLFTFSLVMPGCNDDDDASPDARYIQVNLVSDVNNYGVLYVDPNLVNAWGMAIGPTGDFWIAATEKDLSTIYDRNGAPQMAPVDVEGEPTGVVYNATADFVIPSTTTAAKYIFAGEEGTIQAWASGSSAVEVAENDEAVYKGAALANSGEANFLYVANFAEGEIEVFDRNFDYVTGMDFEDETIPTGYAPFNIQNIGGKLYVTYALQSNDKYDDVPGAGHGYVNIFNPDGSLDRRFASGGELNSPWGIAKAPSGFNQGSDVILIGNFGDGRINVYSKDGDFIRALMDESDNLIEIDGLWALMFPSNGVPAGDQNHLFFTAGPSDELHGLFGYIRLR